MIEIEIHDNKPDPEVGNRYTVCLKMLDSTRYFFDASWDEYSDADDFARELREKLDKAYQDACCEEAHE